MTQRRSHNNWALPGASPVNAISRFIKRYFIFTGRASRSEFWWWLSLFAVVSFGLAILNKTIVEPLPTGADTTAIVRYSLETSTLQLIWAAINFTGAVSLTVRRLHDVGLSGWWWFVQLVPVCGWVAALIIVAQPPTAKGNRFDRDLSGVE